VKKFQLLHSFSKISNNSFTGSVHYSPLKLLFNLLVEENFGGLKESFDLTRECEVEGRQQQRIRENFSFSLVMSCFVLKK